MCFDQPSSPPSLLDTQEFVALFASVSPAAEPRPTIPLAEHDGRVLIESLLLCEYVDEALASPAPKLWGDDPAARYLARHFLNDTATTLTGAFMGLVSAKEQPAMLAAAAALGAAMRLAERFLTKHKLPCELFHVAPIKAFFCPRGVFNIKFF